jgi:hypothetical protein
VDREVYLIELQGWVRGGGWGRRRRGGEGSEGGMQEAGGAERGKTEAQKR